MDEEKPKGLDSGAAILLALLALNISVAEKIDMIMTMIRKTEVCPTCGNEKETGFLSAAEARKLLGF